MVNETKHRFYDIDLMRFVAAFSVMLFHYTFRGNAADNMFDVAYPIIGLVSRYGFLGVDLFFIISGFVILLTARNRDVRGFVISRIVRLYPAVWFCVTLTFIAITLFGKER